MKKLSLLFLLAAGISFAAPSSDRVLEGTAIKRGPTGYTHAIPAGTANDTFTLNNATQTLTNKTLTSPTLNSPTITSPTITDLTRASVAAGTAYRVVVNGSDGRLSESSLTASRALASDSNGLPVASTTTAAELLHVNGVTSSLCGINQSCTLTSKTLTAPAINGGTLDSATITGAVLDGDLNSLSDINLATQVKGNLPVTNQDGGTNASVLTFWRGDGQWATPAGAGDVSGPGTSVDGEMALFNGTSGTSIKRMTGSGIVRLASGVPSVVTNIANADIDAAAGIVDTKLATIATAGKVSNSATTATSTNTNSAIVARDGSGNFSAGTITAALNGNASTVTTNANLSGDVSSVGNTTTIGALKVTNGMLAGSIAASKLVGSDISTVGTVTAGTWSASTIAADKGGTGQTSYTTGDILYASGASALSKLSAAADGKVLISKGAGVAPDYQVINQSGDLMNVGLAASVSSNALTIALKQADGASDTSASAPARIGFRSATLTSGAFNVRSVTGSLSTVISSGSTAGHQSTRVSTLWIYALDNAGTVELAWSSKRFPDYSVQSTTAEGGAGAADSSALMYSTTARSNVPVRLLGRMLSTQTTAGTWAAVPTEVFVGSIAPTEVGIYQAHTFAGYGSTNTKIRYFTTEVLNQPNDLVNFNNNSTTGLIVTAYRRVRVSMSFWDNTGAAGYVCISRNSSQLTTACSAITTANRVAMATTSASGFVGSVSLIVVLDPGDYLAPHTEGDAGGTAARSGVYITAEAI